MRKLRSWDPVQVISGKYKGNISTIEKFVGDDYPIVKGVNEVKRATKGKWFVKKTLPIHISNIMYYVEEKKQATKIKLVVDKKWKKTREAKKFKFSIK